MQLFERLMDLLLLTAADKRLLRVVVGVGKQLFQPFKAESPDGVSAAGRGYRRGSLP